LSQLFAFGFWAFVLTLAGINAIFVFGLQLQAGTTGLLNFGHVCFMAAGAYTMGLILVHGGSLWIAIPAALLAGAALGMILGIPTLRLRADYFAITTIAAGEILRIVIQNNPGADPENPDSGTGGTEGLSNASGPWKQFNRDVLGWFEDHGMHLDRRVPLLVLVWIVAAIVGVVLWYLSRSPWGRALKAVRENEDAASALGKNVFWLKLQSLALGASVAALAGVMFTFQSTTLSPEDFLPIITFLGFAILILGGVGSYAGVIAGTLIISFIQAAPRFLEFSFISEDKAAALRWVIVGLIIMGVMAFRPQGIFGKKSELHLDV
jgi:branched-chain amino acid transport system permease protein